MDFIDRLRQISNRIAAQIENIKTEEASKTALVMPFIQALGYDVFDPSEVVPEFTADVATKKGEKVDYAIVVNGKPAILIECKWEGPELSEKHSGQLFRYFSVTPARIGVLTNGVVYRFYSDLDETNKMDERPFLVVDLRELQEAHVPHLKPLTKGAFSLEEMLSAAGELKYTREITSLFSQQLKDPAEEFVRFFASRVYTGKRFTDSVREQFTPIVKRAIAQFINDQVNNRIKSALDDSSREDDTPNEAANGSDIVTTAEELECFSVVKAILRQDVDPSRIYLRDAKSYCAVLLDDNNRKPICRFWFNSVKKKQIGLFGTDKKERKVPIAGPDDIYAHADELRAALALYAEAA